MKRSTLQFTLLRERFSHLAKLFFVGIFLISQLGAFAQTREVSGTRITSYNVCYTKLLRVSWIRPTWLASNTIWESDWDNDYRNAKHMRRNFFDTVLSFMNIRQQEISIQANYSYENLKLVPTIETMQTRKDPNFIKTLYSIFHELPKPLQFSRDVITSYSIHYTKLYDH